MILQKGVNKFKASFLEDKKSTHVYLEKLSTMTKPYDLPPRLVVLVGPKRSMWSSCKGLEVETQFFYLKEIFLCFPLTHASHNLFRSKDNLGNLTTRLFWQSLDMTYMLAWPSLLCYSQLSSSFLAIRHTLLEDKSFKCTT